MRFLTTLLALFLAVPTLSAPSPLLDVEQSAGPAVHGRYIVKLKNGASKAKIFKQLRNSNVTHDWNVIHGFAGQLDEDAVDVLRASPDVDYIAQDAIMHTLELATQTDAPWGLPRMTQPGRLANQNPNFANFVHKYNTTGGKGVDIYIVDTGVYLDHSEFEGRARWGVTFGGYADADGNGHGTHVAGTAAGIQCGVAKAANIIAVKVLGDDGISGLNWISESAKASGRPSIASLSIGGSASTPLDNAVTALVNKGIYVTVAAGNSNVDAGNTSPARAFGSITVGASTITDARASFSNYGAVVDIFAPGQTILSAWPGAADAGNFLSGTSMATPHVAGLVANFIGKYGAISPAKMGELIQKSSVKGILSNIPAGTVNYLAQDV